MSETLTSLRQKLAEMMTLRPAEYRAMLDRVTETLRRTALDQVLAPGERLPDFVLPDAAGGFAASADLLARGPLVLVFFRGDWCPFCRETLTALEAIVPDLTEAGASLAAVTFDTGDYLDSDWRGLKLSFPVLSDMDGALALGLGTMFRVPDDLRGFYERLGIDIGARHGAEDWFLPIPAAFVVDGGGIVRHVHASGDVTDRMEPRDILACVRGLAGAG